MILPIVPLSCTKNSIINTILHLAFFFTLLYVLELFLYQYRDTHTNMVMFNR